MSLSIFRHTQFIVSLSHLSVKELNAVFPPPTLLHNLTLK